MGVTIYHLLFQSVLEPNSGHGPRDYLTEKEPVISILATEFYLPEEADEFVVWLLIRILSGIGRSWMS